MFGSQQAALFETCSLGRMAAVEWRILPWGIQPRSSLKRGATAVDAVKVLAQGQMTGERETEVVSLCDDMKLSQRLFLQKRTK